MLINKLTASDVVILLAFKVLNHTFFCTCTELLCRQMIQLLSNKTTSHFQLLPMSNVDQPNYAFMTSHLYIDLNNLIILLARTYPWRSDHNLLLSTRSEPGTKS